MTGILHYPSDVLPEHVCRVLGAGDAAMGDIEARARATFPGMRLIVWKGDPKTFAFSEVGGDAEWLSGYPREEWVGCPSFWVDRLVHPEDRRDAVAYCVLASQKACDHVFEYRAVHPAGGVAWLRDYVQVVRDARSGAALLRGLMLDVTGEKRTGYLHGDAPSLRIPSEQELRRMA